LRNRRRHCKHIRPAAVDLGVSISGVAASAAALDANGKL
jgi:hypothetical protein